MFDTAALRKQFTIEEYLYREVRSEWKNEYFNGKIVRRKDVVITQCLMAANITTAIHQQLDEIADTNVCVVGSGLLTYIPQFNFIIYPGAAIAYQNPEFLTVDKNVLLNPLLIIEIFSASDIEYNHSSRFQYFKTLPSFCEYVFVEQDSPFVSSLYKSDNNSWTSTEATQLNQSIFLRSINCSIDLKRIYKNVEFAKPV